jgi:hypothetical protein
MYWIYLIIFILIILTPKLVSKNFGFLREEDIEALLIFCFGTFGFMIYLAKEKALLRAFREKLHLQKQANIITRDLSDSYSYIGEMNRKLDIVKDLIFRLPQATAEAFSRDRGTIYASLLETVGLLAKTDQVILCFVDTKGKEIQKMVQKESVEPCTLKFTPAQLLSAGKFFWEEEECMIVRSPKQAKGVTAFIVFAKTRNSFEDGEVFKILVSQALLLYCVEQGLIS